MYPLISVVIIGYKRIEDLKKTYGALINHIDYPRSSLELILCDDGSPKEMQEEMRKLDFDKYLFANKNEGIGKNTNKGISSAQGEYIIQIQDDWVYNGDPKIIQKSLKIFDKYEDLGMIRFRKSDLSNTLIDKKDGEKVHVYINNYTNKKIAGDYPYTDNPHIKRRCFHEMLGLYIENQPMHKTELEFCQRVAKQKKIKIAYVEGLEGFKHIGVNSFNPNTKREKIISSINENLFGKRLLQTYRSIKKKT